jgi:7-cyano-7-deazaguanine synthase
MNIKEKVIVLMSGGLDSTVCAAIAHSEHYDIHALHINYGQKTESREEQSFNDICSYYSIDKRLHVDIGYLKVIGGSSLLDNSIEISKADLFSTDIPNSYVPFRNANMLCIAVSWAEVIKATKIYIGAVQEDSSGYPDCR